SLLVIIVIFFFSSRRRHTRSKRDWSSDVCSSDLPQSPEQSELPAALGHQNRKGVDDQERPDHQCDRGENQQNGTEYVDNLADGRSEERRVGKEGRARGATE